MDTLAGLYLQNAYLRSFDAQVIDVEPGRVALDRTLFCPGEGGQLPDRGWLRWENTTVNVKQSSAGDGVFWHEVIGTSPPVGATVTGELDWSFRSRMMRTHTALHLMRALAMHLGGAAVVRANVRHDGLRLHVRADWWSPELAADIQRAANAVIAADLPVLTYTLTREEACETPLLCGSALKMLPEHVDTVRVVEIEGVALDLDAGTHVRSTREIGGVQIVHDRPLGKGLHQLELRLGSPVRKQLVFAGRPVATQQVMMGFDQSQADYTSLQLL
jgi:misacylated tRNA(Ala) deacylase